MMTWKLFSRCLFLLLAGLLLTWNVTPTFATNAVVSDCNDSGGPNQIRAKLAAAQSSGGGTITFTCGGPIVLDAGQGTLPTITTNTTINGGGTITISGNNAVRVFIVNSGATLTLNNITISNASAGTDGGAIVNFGTLNVNNSKFSNNQAASGFSGGAIQSFGTMNISGSEFASNSAGNGGVLFLKDISLTTITGSSFHDNQTTNMTNGWGGAMLVWNGAQMNIDSTGFISNTARFGGGIYVTSVSAITPTNSNMMTNQATPYYGGSIENLGNVSLSNVTLKGNSATRGGAIENSGTAALMNVTFSGNSASHGGAIQNSSTAALVNITLSGNSAFVGGGIINQGTVNLTNVTLSANSATIGGGIYNNGGTVNLTNTLLAKGALGKNCENFGGGNYNLSDDNWCGFGSGRDNVTNLLLGPLADNGGFTKTHLPGANSAAIDNGTGSGCPPTDQRGKPRPVGLACDVGAVERQTIDGAIFLPLILR